MAISKPLPWRDQWRLRVSAVGEMFQMPRGLEEGWQGCDLEMVGNPRSELGRVRQKEA